MHLNLWETDIFVSQQAIGYQTISNKAKSFISYFDISYQIRLKSNLHLSFNVGYATPSVTRIENIYSPSYFDTKSMRYEKDKYHAPTASIGLLFSPLARYKWKIGADVGVSGLFWNSGDVKLFEVSNLDTVPNIVENFSYKHGFIEALKRTYKPSVFFTFKALLVLPLFEIKIGNSSLLSVTSNPFVQLWYPVRNSKSLMKDFSFNAGLGVRVAYGFS
jgi:hypothetical protein